MKKVVFALCLLALLLVACGPKTTGKRVAMPAPSGVTGAVSSQVSQPTTEPAASMPKTEKTKSAAEVLSELKSQEGTPTAVTPGAKTGTFYPPVKVTGTGKDALKEKTKALMSGGTAAPENDADKEFGPKYHSSDGDSTNLPGEYGNEGSAGD